MRTATGREVQALPPDGQTQPPRNYRHSMHSPPATCSTNSI